MLLTIQEVNKRIEELENWLSENDLTHYMFRAILKECAEYEEARIHMEYRNVKQLDVNITTAFYNQLNRI